MAKGETPRKATHAGELTIKDIARLAGVSISTVSRALNNSGMVRPDKLRSIRDVLARVDYIPNHAARTLVKRRTMTVGLIVPTLANPLFAPTIAGIEETLAGAGYGLLIACSSRDPERELVHARTMIERGVDGMILTGTHRHPDLLQLMAARGVIAVSQDDPFGTEGIAAVSMPDAAAMACAIDALVRRGHRRIGVLSGPTADTAAIAERLRGALERLAHHGIPTPPDRVIVTPDYSAEAAREATRLLLAEASDLTAIACTGDILALGVISQCRRSGRAVPSDISVIGCGQTVMAQFADPELSTVRLPFREMGERAALILLRAMAGEEGAPTPAPLCFELIEGETVA